MKNPASTIAIGMRHSKEGFMLKKLFTVLAVLFTFTAAAADLSVVNYKELQENVMGQAELYGLNWTVGDYADYSFKAGFLPGKIHSFVRELTSEGYWVQQDVDITIQKQKIEILFDKNSGQILKLLVDGKEQNIPDGGDSEIVDIQESSVTVPAGTFDCMYAKIRNNKDNTEQEAWINPSIVPISGLLKSKSPSQMGEVVMELTSYQKK